MATAEEMMTAEYVADLLLMREYYASLPGAQQEFDPLSRETLRIVVILESIDRLVRDLLV